MKIALVITNLRGGGAEKAMVKLADLLAAHGDEVHLVLLENRIEHRVPQGIRLSALTNPEQAAHKGHVGKWLLAWRLRLHVQRLERERPFDFILSTLPFADAIARAARLPRLWHRIANTLSAEIAALARANPAKAQRRLAKYRRLYADSRLIAVSDGVANDLLALGIRFCRIERLYNAFDISAMRRHAADPDECALLPQGAYILHIGRFTPQKRHDLLLTAARELPATHRLVLLCHDDPALRALIETHGMSERTVVAGFRTNPYPWIAGSALLVLCSDHEGMPNALVEALLLGTPVVSTDCPSGPREILRNGRNGRLVPCGDAPMLAQAMLAVLDAPRAAPDFDATPFLPSHLVARIEHLVAEMT